MRGWEKKLCAKNKIVKIFDENVFRNNASLFQNENEPFFFAYKAVS